MAKQKHKFPQIRGCKAAVFHNQLRTSCGIAEFDSLFGGEGLPLGSLFVVEETGNGIYSPYIHKYFLAQGFVDHHHCIDVGYDETFYANLPALNENKSIHQGSCDQESNNDMKIAWRYQNVREIDSNIANKTQLVSASFDLAKKIDPQHLSKIETEYINVRQSSDPCSLLDEIHQKIKQYSLYEPDLRRNACRLSIQMLGSPYYNYNNQSDLVLFLAKLRAILQDTLALCCVTVPCDILSVQTIDRLRSNADAVVRMEVISGSDKQDMPIYKGYHGHLHIIKLPRIGTLKAPTPLAVDLVFKLKRSRLSVEMLHLPPAFSDEKPGCKSAYQETNSMLNF